jgi:hypothetical protein
MKKTSRRNFGKQLTGALAALPVAALGTTPGVSAQTRDVRAPIDGGWDFKSTHDTPPPIVIGAGSLIVERKGPYQNSDIVTEGGRKKHHHNPDTGKKKIFPAHIKVVDGSGEILYRNDRARECLVTVLTRDGDGNSATVNAGASPIVNENQTFVIDTDSRTGFDKTNEKLTSKKRDVRYRQKKVGSKDFSIVDVKITERGDLLYKVTLANLPSSGDDFKVMIWLEQSL